MGIVNVCGVEVGRQHVTQQLAASGINAVLAAPQFAFDILDSSPGNFWRDGYFPRRMVS